MSCSGHENLKQELIKPPQAKWIVDQYNTLKDDKEIAVNGFRRDAKDIIEKVGNPVKEVSF